ncbi:RNA polymerase sigma factor [Candidatus Uabimicrobium amorphum]|nr:RNA polymerase sigma factor [Candidatus Uabimicrobium amorphum]
MTSFEEQLEHAIPGLIRYGKIVLGNVHDAEDFAQEVVLRTWRKRHLYALRKGKVTTWLYGFATKVLQEKLRKKKNAHCHHEILESIYVQWAKQQDVYCETPLEFLQECLEHVSSQDREILQLRYQDEYALPKIAQKLDKSVSAIKVHLHRLRKNLFHCIHRKMNKS